jgi:hypothetical protein
MVVGGKAAILTRDRSLQHLPLPTRPTTTLVAINNVPGEIEGHGPDGC